MKTDIMKTYRDQAIESFYKFHGYAAITEDQMHVVDIAKSIMMHRDEVLDGGGFVTAFVNNDLGGAIGRADKTIINYFPFLNNVKYHSHVNC
jgi:hypothetical protein